MDINNYFCEKLFLFTKNGDIVNPIKVIELTDTQKKLLVAYSKIFMVPKTKYIVNIPLNKSIASDKLQREEYAPVVCQETGKISGIYKVWSN